jgi:acyl-CoA thioesterase-2
VNQDFAALLELEQAADRFTAVPAGEGHLFGGYTVALALRAAGMTVADHLRPHSLHAYFLDPGVAGQPLTIDVQRWRDGRSFAVRQVAVGQNGGTPLLVTASFHVGEEGPDWHETAVLPPGPDGLRTDLSMLGSIDPVEFRPVNGLRAEKPEDELPRLHPYWARLRQPLPDDPLLHACALAFVSDYMVVSSAQVADAPAAADSTVVTLDHAVWFHRPAAYDDWLLYSAQPASVSEGRGLGRGTVHTRDGQLLASFAQEALTRPPPGDASDRSAPAAV